MSHDVCIKGEQIDYYLKFIPKKAKFTYLWVGYIYMFTAQEELFVFALYKLLRFKFMPT